jgi:hypothetical protein
MKQIVLVAFGFVCLSSASLSRILEEEPNPLYLKANNGTTIAAFIDDNGDGENDLGEKIVNYKINSQPEVTGEETPKYPKEVDTQGEETYDEEITAAKRAVIKKSAKKKLLLPEISLIEPMSRLYSNLTAPNEQPCGGIDKAKVHFIATPGSRHFFQWKVSYPHPEGNCTFRVGTGLDLEEQDEGRFIALQPRDGSGNEQGSFACGREVGYEGKEFRLPKNFTCDKCTLQFEWDLGEGRQIHQCADFLMSSNEIEECSGKCLNGGVCVNAECACRTNFYGDVCQNKSKDPFYL